MIVRSDEKLGVSVSVEVPVIVPIYPLAAVIVAVLDRFPVVDGAMLAMTVYVNEPPAGTLTVSLIFPLPFVVQRALFQHLLEHVFPATGNVIRFGPHPSGDYPVL